jgi:hypothetical protein
MMTAAESRELSCCRRIARFRLLETADHSRRKANLAGENDATQSGRRRRRGGI